MNKGLARHRGVSLIEALVALAVMAFGMLGVVGMQATMRYSGDIAKQRSEAVRIAQERIEQRRAFSVYDTTDGLRAFADIITRSEVDVPGGTNASYKLSESVADLDGGRSKLLSVVVTWKDRTDQTQAVRLNTTVTKVLPELGATLGIPAYGAPNRLPDGRHSAVPRAAVDQGDGTSKFAPPSAGGTEWVFNNTTGYITQTCAGGTCTDMTARLLTGYISFSTDATQPTAAMAELPTSVATMLDVTVNQTFPATTTVNCYEAAASTFKLVYYCALVIENLAGAKWSGQSVIDIAPLAASVADADASKFRVCRYTPARDSHPVVPTISNAEHPLNYSDVTAALTQQNFLVIRAGDGITAFTCPADDASTPFINGNTWHHQPSA